MRALPFLGLLLGLSLCISVSEIQERDALVDFYTATNGSYWFTHDNWGVGLPCQNDWFGVQCDLTPAPSVVYLYESLLSYTDLSPRVLTFLSDRSAQITSLGPFQPLFPHYKI